MATIRFKVSVVAINTHHNGADYYGPARATMTPVAPANVTYISACINRALFGGMGHAVGHIVVFPEFILQPQEGAYNVLQRDHVLAHLQHILTALPVNVLVVFGTVVSQGAGSVYYNEMPYGIGGGALLYTCKQWLSNIDLIDRRAAVGSQLIHWHGGRLKQGEGAGVQRNWSQIMAPSHTVNFRGARVGFSVCLDYTQGVLANRLPVNGEVNIHVVTSCGMAFENRAFMRPDHNATLPNGAVIVCDAQGDQSSVHRIRLGGTSFHRSSMTTHTHSIGGLATKIRNTTFLIQT